MNCSIGLRMMTVLKLSLGTLVVCLRKSRNLLRSVNDRLDRTTNFRESDRIMKFICKKCGSKFPLIPKLHGVIHVTFYPNEPKPTESCDGEVVPITEEGEG